MATFAENLKELLRKSNTTQLQLANELGLTAASVSRYCTSNQLPRADIISQIAKYFNVSVDYLLGDLSNSESDDLYTQIIDDYLSVPKNLIIATLPKLSEEEHKQLLDYMMFLLSKHEEYKNITNSKDTPI